MKLDIVIDREADAPLYRQISRQIIEAIYFSTLSPNEQLPTLRTLASALHINLHTVRHAYQVLKQEGIITIIQGKGAFVSTAIKKGKETINRSANWLKSKINGLISEAKRAGLKSNNMEEIIKFLGTFIFPKIE